MVRIDSSHLSSLDHIRVATRICTDARVCVHTRVIHISIHPDVTYTNGHQARWLNFSIRQTGVRTSTKSASLSLASLLSKSLTAWFGDPDASQCRNNTTWQSLQKKLKFLKTHADTQHIELQQPWKHPHERLCSNVPPGGSLVSTNKSRHKACGTCVQWKGTWHWK